MDAHEVVAGRTQLLEKRVGDAKEAYDRAQRNLRSWSKTVATFNGDVQSLWNATCIENDIAGLQHGHHCSFTWTVCEDCVQLRLLALSENNGWYKMSISMPFLKDLQPATRERVLKTAKLFLDVYANEALIECGHE
jgi:hypothetical protein